MARQTDQGSSASAAAVSTSSSGGPEASKQVQWEAAPGTAKDAPGSSAGQPQDEEAALCTLGAHAGEVRATNQYATLAWWRLQLASSPLRTHDLSEADMVLVCGWQCGWRTSSSIVCMVFVPMCVQKGMRACLLVGRYMCGGLLGLP